jgi:hypothetical protein
LPVGQSSFLLRQAILMNWPNKRGKVRYICVSCNLWATPPINSAGGLDNRMPLVCENSDSALPMKWCETNFYCRSWLFSRKIHYSWSQKRSSPVLFVRPRDLNSTYPLRGSLFCDDSVIFSVDVLLWGGQVIDRLVFKRCDCTKSSDFVKFSFERTRGWLFCGLPFVVKFVCLGSSLWLGSEFLLDTSNHRGFIEIEGRLVW